MNTGCHREAWDIEAVKSDSSGGSIYYGLPERRRTEAVSLAAVTAYGGNLEYVPDGVKNREICRAALQSKDVDFRILREIPYPDVQKEGIAKFSGKVEPFVLYSFADITDAATAKAAVNADGYCLQFVPDRLMTEELCKIALQSSNADKKVPGFIPDRFFTPAVREMAVKRFENGTDRLSGDRRTPAGEEDRQIGKFRHNERKKWKI
jgi:hypothetical protein